MTCLEVDECTVSFEPEGTVVRLKRGTHLTVEMRGSEDGQPELSYLPDGIVVGAWPGAETQVWDETGNEIQI